MGSTVGKGNGEVEVEVPLPVKPYHEKIFSFIWKKREVLVHPGVSCGKWMEVFQELVSYAAAFQMGLAGKLSPSGAAGIQTFAHVEGRHGSQVA